MDSDNHFCHSLPSVVWSQPFPSFCSSTAQWRTHEVDQETELAEKQCGRLALQPGLPCGRAHCWASTMHLAALGHENMPVATTEQTTVTQYVDTQMWP